MHKKENISVFIALFSINIFAHNNFYLLSKKHRIYAKKSKINILEIKQALQPEKQDYKLKR